MNIQEFTQPVIFHSQLNPLLWDGSQLNSRVRLKLLTVARAFIDSLKLEQLPLTDIVITGSNTNLTYTPQSDLDLHIIVDMGKMFNGHHLVSQFFDSKRRLWNNTYDVKIKGIDVEVYVEDSKETVEGNAYSIMTDQWLRRKPLSQTEYDDRSVQVKYHAMAQLIDRLLADADSNQDLADIMQKLKQYRQSGLDRHGEFSTENLVFKALRNNGYLEKIQTVRTQLVNKTLSLAEKQKFF